MTEARRLSGRDARTYARVLLTVIVLGLVSFVLTLTAFVAAAFLHSLTWGRAGMAALVICTLALATSHGLRLSLALRLGQWTSSNGTPIDRRDQPARFWASTLTSIVVLVIYTAVPLALGYFVLFEPPFG
jgi:hypothetical protein